MTTKAHDPIPPGEILLEEFLQPMGISRYRLAKTMGVPPRRINEIGHGKRRITPETGIRISKALGTSEHFWVNLQLDFEAMCENDSVTPTPAPETLSLKFSTPLHLEFLMAEDRSGNSPNIIRNLNPPKAGNNFHMGSGRIGRNSELGRRTSGGRSDEEL